MTRSLRLRLFMMVLASSLLLWLCVVGFTWWRTSDEIHNVFDAELTLVAQLLAVATKHEAEEFDLDDYETDLNAHGIDYPLIFQVWSGEDRLMVRGPNAPTHPLDSLNVAGFSDSEFGGGTWRVYTHSLLNGEYHIQVARDHAALDDLILQFVLNVIKPLLMAIPLLGMLWLGIRRGLEPLYDLSALIGQRDFTNLMPLSGQAVPSEVSVLVRELNGLLSRLQAATERNSRFTADVAHELRTPIAGALVQVQSLVQDQTDEERRHGVEQARAALIRLNYVVDQLLTLASIEPEQMRSEFTPVDLNALVGEVFAEQRSKAVTKGIDLELHSSGKGISLRGNRELLAILLSNLVNNASNASPVGGRVIVRLIQLHERVSLVVEDNGPGIPAAQKSWVFERFNRLASTQNKGAGLGLSIVREITELHQARINLQDQPKGSGLIVTVDFFP